MKQGFRESLPVYAFGAALLHGVIVATVMVGRFGAPSAATGVGIGGSTLFLLYLLLIRRAVSAGGLGPTAPAEALATMVVIVAGIFVHFGYVTSYEEAAYVSRLRPVFGAQTDVVRSALRNARPASQGSLGDEAGGRRSRTTFVAYAGDPLRIAVASPSIAPDGRGILYVTRVAHPPDRPGFWENARALEEPENPSSARPPRPRVVELTVPETGDDVRIVDARFEMPPPLPRVCDERVRTDSFDLLVLAARFEPFVSEVQRDWRRNRPDLLLPLIAWIPGLSLMALACEAARDRAQNSAREVVVEGANENVSARVRRFARGRALFFSICSAITAIGALAFLPYLPLLSYSAWSLLPHLVLLIVVVSIAAHFFGLASRSATDPASNTPPIAIPSE